MSMHHDATKADHADDDEEQWIEAEIQRELEALGSVDLEEEPSTGEKDAIQGDSSSDQDDAEEQGRTAEMDEYIQRMQAQAARLEEELEECDELIHRTDLVVSTPVPEKDDIVLLAQERGMDAETLKRKVLAELDKEDMEDERLLLESVNEDLDQTENNALAITENPHPEAHVSDSGDGQLSSESKSAFLTGVEEEKRTEEEEYLELRRNFLGGGREEEKKEQEDEEQNDEEEKEEEPEDQEKDENDYSGKFMLNPGEGTIMSMVDSEALERRVMREVLDWEQKWMAKNEQREQELATIISLEKEREAEIRRQREQRQKEVEQEQQNLHKQQQDVEEKLRKEAEVLQLEIEESIEQYQTEIEMLTESVRMESASLLKSKEQGKKEEDEKRELSALKIQAAYRGYRVYKEEGVKVKEHLEEWKKQKTEARIKAIEKSRKEKADEKKRKEDAEQRKEEEKKKKEEEKLRKEEEKKKKSEEKKKLKEEEEKRKLEEKRQKEEEERKRKEEEKKRKEEEAKRKEEEKKKKEEAKREQERKKREEEVLRLQKLKEEEARQLEEQKQAEEKKKREEEELKRAEEERRKVEEEEERKRQEAEAEAAAKRAEEENVKQLGLGTPLSPVPPEGRPKTPRKKINDLRRSTMSPLANGVKSPPSSAGSQRSGPASETDSGQPGTSTSNSRTEALPITARSVTGLKTPRTARSDMSLSLPELIEKSRLEWIEKCRPWSKTERELKTKNKSEISRKPLRRPISAKNMSVLPEDQILLAAGVASLQQVTTVELHDLPGSSLKTLGQCTRLKTLKVTNCGTVTTEGLGDCKHLVYLDMQHNALETINLRDLERLVYLDLSHNCLTTLQGLEGCASLRYLRAAHNRMTRITGLEGMKSLHTLDLSHNQLITTKGLGAVPTLQEVDLTHNHLPSLDDLDHLGLLQVLKAGGNNIIQPPLLTNHVLIRQLSLEDNSLCSINNLSQCWLPLLRQLTLGQNSLTSLEDLSTCVSLQDLDISNNQILDIESLSSGLQSCRHLTQLKTEGNPAREEPEFSSSVVKLVPSLEKLDGKAVGSPRAAPPTVTDFENMCLEQLAIWDKLTSQYQQVLSGITDILSVASVHVRYFTTSHNVAVEQRYAHEYGEVNTDSTRVNFDLTPEPPGTPQGPPGKTHSDASKMKNKFEQALQNVNGSNSAPDGKEILKNSINSEGIRQSVRKVGRGNIGADVIGKKLQQRGGLGDSDRHAAATRIQALWRGYQIRRDIDQHSRWWLAATTIQAAWRGHFTRTVLREMGYLPIPGGKDDRRYKAATLIQATWRGYLVRKRIQYALNYARMSFGEDEMDEDLDFTEVDLSAFDFNEDDLEKGWTPPETPQLPANHAVIGKPSSTQQAAAAKAAFDAAFSPPGPKPPSGPISLVKRPPHPPQHPPLHHPRHAWRNVDSPLSDVPPLGSRPPLPPLSRLSDHSAAETHRTGETSQRTFRSRKEEQLTEEWGFKDTKTAELMMQRAKKLKYNAARKKKISQLDPRQRLALFRKLEETTTVPHVKPPPKKIMPRKEYFQAREEEVQQKAMEKQRDQVNHHQRTYEWIHTQVGSYPAGASSRINQGLNEASHHNSEGNLPQIDPNVLAGARHNLTGSPMSLDIQSLDSVSTAGDLHRRHSSGGDPAARLPPIKVSSAPSAHVSERMSFRNPKPKATLESVGWGSGKKRANRR